MENKIQNIYPLSKLQKGMIFHYALNEKSTEYFEQMELEINGKLDVERFKEALCYLVKKYDILRTAFVYKETKEPKQVVLKEKEFIFHYEDIVSLEPSAQLSHYQTYLKKDRGTPFDLTKGPLLRFSLFKLTDSQYRLIFSFHHIILDGWSIGIFFSELLNSYEKILTEVEEVSGYGEMVKKDPEKEEADKKYWAEYLADSKEPQNFFYTEISDQKQSKLPSKKTLQLSEVETNALNKLTKELSLSKSVIYESLWSILLNKFCSSEDIIFGKVVSGRHLPGRNVEQLMGMFINTIPKRVKINGRHSLRELMENVNKDNLKNLKHETYSLDDIQKQSPNGSNLFNHLFVYENYPLQEALDKNDVDKLGFEIVYVDTFEQTNYDLNVIVSPGKKDELIMRFNEGIYSEQNIQLLLTYYHLLIQQLTADLDKPIDEIYLLDNKDKMLIEKMNQTSRPQVASTIIEQFAKMVEMYPELTAISYEGKQLTYQELAAKISDVQQMLQQEGVNKEDRVGIYMTNSIEQIIYLLAILSLGASYVPLDKKVPFNRITYMIEDSNLKLVVSNQECEQLTEKVSVLFAEEVDSIKGNGELKVEKLKPTSEICVFYTSGTTGNPKGVALINQNIERMVLNNGFLTFDSTDVILQLANYSFDGSLLNIFSALVNGGKLVLVPNEKYTDVAYLKKCIKTEQITKFFVTTSLFNILTDTIGKESFKELKAIMFGGEKASPKHCKDALGFLEQGVLINGYGPTECGIFTTAYSIVDLKTMTGNIPIGRPVANTEVYIANDDGQLLTPTIVGEIYVTGKGLVNGYLNDSEETKKNFVQAPIKEETIFYKTGDLGYMDQEGVIHYVGRKDNQYKIRGYRIELEEIEANINKNSAVKNAIVQARTQGTNIMLVCYYTSDTLGIKDYQQWVKRLLPEYMVPRKFYRVSKFPINKNGKINRQALDELIIEKESYEQEEAFSALALQIKEAWEAVLGQGIPSKNINFYDVGGDSIRAVMLYSELQKRDIQIEMEDLVSNTSIQMQEEYILSKKDQSKKDTQKVRLVSKKHSHHLVLFPAFLPRFANENMGNILASNVSGYSIFVAGFYDENNLYQKYADEVEGIMEKGDPITFLGYSFGGNIAFEVIKELEKRGHQIDQLILVDSYMLEKFWFADPKDLVIEVDKYLEEYLSVDEVSVDGLRNEMLQQMSAYCDFINNYKGIYSPIHTDIYMITSNEPIEDDQEDLRVIWKNITSGDYSLYHGFGTHTEMWRTNYLEKNMIILNDIIHEIEAKN